MPEPFRSNQLNNVLFLNRCLYQGGGSKKIVPLASRSNCFLAKVIFAFFIAVSAISTTIYFVYFTKKTADLNEACGKGISVTPPSLGDPTKTGLCCSKDGFAGYTPYHCGIGCQSQYGRCNLSNQSIPPVFFQCTRLKDFALTFDDGPSEFTESLLDYLKSAKVKATFFMNGNSWKSNYTLPFSDQPTSKSSIFERANIVKRAFLEGHQICSHTWSHINIIKENSYNLTYEISRLNYHFAQILGKVPTCIRPPYGSYGSENTATSRDGTYKSPAAFIYPIIIVSSFSVLQAMGYGPDATGGIIGWDFDPQDWNQHKYGANNTLVEMQNLMSSLNRSIPPGAISLLHDVAPITADFGTLIPRGIKPFAQIIVEYFLGNGWNFVTVDECIGNPVGSMYRHPSGSDFVCGDSASFYGKSSCTV